MRDYYEAGNWNAICDRCGRRRKANLLSQDWTGLRVCRDTCFETRHPQTLIHVPQEQVTTPWARPEPADVFIKVNEPLFTESNDWLVTQAGIIINSES